MITNVIHFRYGYLVPLWYQYRMQWTLPKVDRRWRQPYAMLMQFTLDDPPITEQDLETAERIANDVVVRKEAE